MPCLVFQYAVHNTERHLTRLRMICFWLFLENVLENVLDADLFYVAVTKIVFTITNHLLQGLEMHGKPLGTLCRAPVHNAEQKARRHF